MILKTTMIENEKTTRQNFTTLNCKIQLKLKAIFGVSHCTNVRSTNS